MSGRPTRLVAKLIGLLGADRAVAYGALAVGVTFVGGPVTAVLIALVFSSEVQGFYYTFTSLLLLKMFVELGFAQVIVQFASHEFAHLTRKDRRGVEGPPETLSRLSSLSRLVIRWYWRGSVLVWLGLLAGGILFFSTDPASDQVEWLGPWIAVTLITALDFCLLPLWSLMRGADNVRDFNFARLVAALVMLPVVWAGILGGLELWSLALGQLAMLAWNVIYLSRHRNFYRAMTHRRSGPAIDWRREVLPVQWRIAVSWISGYFVYQLFTPVTFRVDGPVVAGQMGMTMSLALAITAFGSTWVQTRAPAFGALIARGRFGELDRAYRKAAVGAFAVTTALCVAATGVIAALDWSGLEIADRLLPAGTAALLFASVALLQISIGQAVYLRAHRAEPLMWLSVAQAVLVTASTIGLGYLAGPEGIVAGYLAITILFVVPYSTWLFARLRREWHAPSGEEPGLP